MPRVSRAVAHRALCLDPRVARLIATASVLLAALAVLSTTVRAGQGLWGEGYIPNAKVIDQDGKEHAFYDDLVKDKIVVVSFIYTTCKDICPLVTARLGLLAERLGAHVGRDIHFISVSIDPVHDTPERLKAHADAFHTGPGWTFVTGAPDDIALIRYKLGERSRELTEHRNEIMLGNDRTGQWARDSAFSDIVVLAANVLNMDPQLRDQGDASSVSSHSSERKPRLDQAGRILFTKTCASCHTIGYGERIGPDLAGVLQRRARPWIERYLAEPERVRGSHDAVADELSRRYPGVRMPNLGLSETDIADILSFLEATGTAGYAMAPAGQQHRP